MNTPRPGFRLRAAWAAILSVVAPGLGQVYARAWRLGIALASVSVGLSLAIRLIASRNAPTIPAISAVAAAILLSFVLMLAAAADAARRILKAGPGPLRPSDAKHPVWFRPTWIAAIVLLGLGFGLNAALPLMWRHIGIASGAMIPTLMPGDAVAADIRPGLRVRRGDVILFTHVVAVPNAAPNAAPAPAPAALFVKRVIAMPGDHVAIRDGRLVLNGQPVPRRDDRPFIIPQYMSFGINAQRWTETLPDGVSYQVVTSPDAPKGTDPLRTMAEMTVPPGHIFVIGDNRDNSLDSRVPGFGTVPIAEVIGKAQTIYWSSDRTRSMTPVMAPMP